MNNTFNDDLPMPQNDDMPPLPGIGEVGPQVCATVQLYLGVMDDLTAEQVVKLRSILHYSGLPIDARSITDELLSQEGYEVAKKTTRVGGAGMIGGE